MGRTAGTWRCWPPRRPAAPWSSPARCPTRTSPSTTRPGTCSPCPAARGSAGWRWRGSGSCTWRRRPRGRRRSPGGPAGRTRPSRTVRRDSSSRAGRRRPSRSGCVGCSRTTDAWPGSARPVGPGWRQGSRWTGRPRDWRNCWPARQDRRVVRVPRPEGRTRMSQDTIVSTFHSQVERLGDRRAMRYRRDGEWRDITWREYGNRVREVAMGLVSLGVERGDAVAIYSPNRPEWHVADIAAMCIRARTVPIYLNNAPAQVAYVLGHSESTVVFVSGEEQLLKVDKHRDQCPALRHAVTFDGVSSADGFVVSWDDLRARGRAVDAERPGGFEESWRAVRPEDVATIVYTSGTTGK